jgi:hypothetical protein
MSLIDRMMDRMLGKMSKEEKEEMMGRMIEKFLADMTKEDKQKMMGIWGSPVIRWWSSMMMLEVSMLRDFSLPWTF